MTYDAKKKLPKNMSYDAEKTKSMIRTCSIMPKNKSVTKVCLMMPQLPHCTRHPQLRSYFHNLWLRSAHNTFHPAASCNTFHQYVIPFIHIFYNYAIFAN